jgi:hypothetical protein
MTRTFAGLLLAVGIAGALPVQDQDPKAAPVFALDAGDHELRELIDGAARFLGRNYLYSEAELGQVPNTKITLQNPLRLDRQGCEETLSQLAYQLGFAVVPIDRERGVWEVFFLNGPKRGELNNRAIFVRPDEIARYARTKLPITVHVPLQAIQAVAAVNSLRPFFMGQGGNQQSIMFGNVGNAQAVLITGFADQVAQAVEMLRRVDVAPEAAAEVAVNQTWVEKTEQRLTTIEQRLGAVESRIAKLEKN